MATELHHLGEQPGTVIPDASNMNFGIVVADWNEEITGALLDGAVATLEKHGTLPENIHIKHVPGSFELIYGAQQLCHNDGFDAVIILGCVIRGDTALRLYLPRRDLRHRKAQRHTEHPRYLRTAYHQRPATGQRQKWRQTR